MPPGRGWAPLREDAPGRRPPSRGKLPQFSSDVERNKAVDTLIKDFYAPSSQRSMSFKWVTITRALSMWGLSPLPPTPAAVVALAAALKRGQYQSAESYLSLYRVRAEREGYNFDAALNRLMKDAARSCARGRGGPVRPLGLPFLRLGELLGEGDRPWNSEGPVGPGRAVILGAWFMMREQELATSRACLVTLDEGKIGDTCPVVSWCLPASKNDVEASGVSRTHGCCCGPSRSTLCPYHAAKEQIELLKEHFPERFEQERPDEDLPLFPTLEGLVVSKGAMVDTIVEAAVRLGSARSSADGSERVSGHSLRVTGAQGLTAAGLDTWAVQLLGRWGSDTVLSYIRSVPLQKSTEWAKVLVRKSLDEKLKEEAPVETISGGSEGSKVNIVQSDYSEQLEVARVAEKVCLTPHGESRFVRSARGAFHRVGREEGGSASWTSACGWRFSPSDATIFVNDVPETTHYKFLCAKCLGDLRKSRKDALDPI